MRKRLTATRDNVIVYVPEAYESTITTPGGVKFYVNNLVDDTTYVTRHGEVVSSSDSRIKPGDVAYFHHNCVRRVPVTGRETSVDSSNEIMENMFNIDKDLIYLVKRGDEFISIDPWCYVRPVEREKEVVSGIELVNKEKHVLQHGIMVYSNDSLEEQGIRPGDHVIYNLDSEYEFKIGNEVLYRMKTPWIIGKESDED